jgi:hypothetical protein
VITTPSGGERFLEQFAALLSGPMDRNRLADVVLGNWIEFVGRHSRSPIRSDDSKCRHGRRRAAARGVQAADKIAGHSCDLVRPKGFEPRTF